MSDEETFLHQLIEYKSISVGEGHTLIQVSLMVSTGLEEWVQGQYSCVIQ